MKFGFHHIIKQSPELFAQLVEGVFKKDHGTAEKHSKDQTYIHNMYKPKNLLLFDGRLCLSDFGLVRNIADTDGHITEMNEPLDPRAIRPPEFQSVEEIDGVDYQKSDVYLYAKTIWMMGFMCIRGA